MSKILVFVFSILVGFIASCSAKEKEGIERELNIRRPAVAGLFYPKEEEALKDQIEEFLKEVRLPGSLPSAPPNMLIVPHAGYMYSGKIAAYAYYLLKGLSYKTIILIGASHRYPLRGASIYRTGYYLTPLGKIPIDEDVAKKILNYDESFRFIPQAHQLEHSLEVQLPFLQVTLKGRFKIVPILIGELGVCRRLSSALLELINEDVLVILSTDLSHYHPYSIARKLDKKTCEDIKRCNIDEIKKDELCGKGPVLTGLMLADKIGISKISLLKYANSGDITGDKSSVVGYAAFAIYLDFKKERRSISIKLKEKEKKKLLKIARESIESYLKTGKIPDFNVTEDALLQKKGAFVTLERDGLLRGCIGYIQPIYPLYQTVSRTAVAAATEDLRFNPVSLEEMDKIKIEISVLSELRKIESIDEIEVGLHGLYITKGTRSGLLLPQVATEHGWSREEFLQHVCKKAFLPLDAWKDLSTCQLYVFEACIFHEK